MLDLLYYRQRLDPGLGNVLLSPRCSNPDLGEILLGLLHVRAIGSALCSLLSEPHADEPLAELVEFTLSLLGIIVGLGYQIRNRPGVEQDRFDLLPHNLVTLVDSELGPLLHWGRHNRLVEALPDIIRPIPSRAAQSSGIPGLLIRCRILRL